MSKIGRGMTDSNAIDNTKITTQLGWEPAYTFKQGLGKVLDIYNVPG